MTVDLTQLKPDLDAIETALKDNLSSENPVAEELLEHLLLSAGKRIRPLLTILCARLGGNESQSLNLACAVEYLHAASLLHDDILDEAQYRRGKPAAHHIWGNTLTVLGGDFLMARSTKLVTDLEQAEITHKMAKLAENIIQGELYEITSKHNLYLLEQEYYRIIQGKTASLFQAACECGSILGGCTPQEIVVLGQYGLHLGMAFQIADDIADYCSNSTIQGKLPGNDLRESKATLPLILALNKATPAQKEMLEAFFLTKDLDEGDFLQVKNFIDMANGFAETRAIAANHTAKALQALGETRPHSSITPILKALAENVIN